MTCRSTPAMRVSRTKRIAIANSAEKRLASGSGVRSQCEKCAWLPMTSIRPPTPSWRRGGVSDAAGHAFADGGAPNEEVVEDIEAAEGEPGGDMQTEERVARDPDCLVVGCQPSGTRDALRHGCLRVGVETGRRENAGGIDTHGRQIGDEAHD